EWMARKYVSATAPKSKTWMMLGWLRPSAILASSTNIDTNWRERAYAEWIFLMTRVLASPCATVVRARNTSAMPPVPILRTSVYFPNCSMPEPEAAGQCSRWRAEIRSIPRRLLGRDHNGVIARSSNQVSVSQFENAKYSWPGPLHGD